MSLISRAFRNPSAVVIANAGTQSLIRFLSNMILARLLMPTAFALTSITMLIITAIQMASDVGIVVLTLREKSMSEIDQARMWTMQLVRGVLLSLVMLVLAKPIAAFYHAPQLAHVLFALSVVPTIQGAQSLFPILALGQQNLMPNFWVEVLGRVIGAIVSIVVAVLSPTVWALAIGILGQTIFSTAVSHWLGRKGWPKFDLNLNFIRNHWHFSRWIQLSSTITFIASQIDKAIFPLIYGLARFGVYGIGVNFALIPAQITQRWSTNIFYPLVVKSVNGDEAAQKQLAKTRVTMLIYSAIVVMGMIGLSPYFFFILYKPTYHEAARFAMLLTASAYFEMAETSLRFYPMVKRTTRYEFITNTIRLITFVLLISAIWIYKGEAELYAVSFTAAQTVSWIFILGVCVRSGYVTAKADVVLALIIWIAIALAYALPNSPTSLIRALVEGGIIGCTTLALLFGVFKKRGLPSPQRATLHQPLMEN